MVDDLGEILKPRRSLARIGRGKSVCAEEGIGPSEGTIGGMRMSGPRLFVACVWGEVQVVIRTFGWLIAVALLSFALAATPVLADPPRYTIRDFGPWAPNGTNGRDLNNLGQVVGSGDIEVSNERQAIMWLPRATDALPRGVSDLPPLVAQGCEVLGINDAGLVVGWSKALFDDHYGRRATRAVLWDPPGGGVDLGSLTTIAGTGASSAVAINKWGTIAGWSEVDLVPDVVDLFQHPVLWLESDPGQIIDLGTFGGDYGRAVDVNDLDQAVGFATDGLPLAEPPARLIPFLWLPEPAYGHDAGLSELTPYPGSESGQATAINNLGHVVGFARPIGLPEDPEPDHGFLYLPEAHGTLSAGFHDLGEGMVPHDVNDRGEIVGEMDKAFVWSDGVLRMLESEIPGGTDWSLYAAYAINERGQITGRGYIPGVGFRAFLLTPVSASDTNVDGLVDGMDLVDLMACVTGPGAGSGDDCAVADANGDGHVDLLDMGALQNAFTAHDGMNSRDCCTDGAPGCHSAEVEDCVCVHDPFCCRSLWDTACVDTMINLGCAVCEDAD